MEPEDGPVAENMKPELFADVVVDLAVRAVDKLFAYRIPPHLREDVCEGSIVQIPFGKRALAGFVVRLKDALDESQNEAALREVSGVLKRDSPWSRELIELSNWMHQYYGCTFLEALKTSLPPMMKIDVKGVQDRYKIEKVVSIQGNIEEARDAIDKLRARAPQQAKALEGVLEMEGEIPLKSICESTDCDRSVLYHLEKKGLIRIREHVCPRNPTESRNPSATTPLELNPQQRKCFEMISTLLCKRKGSVMLLHGVTGSGKTEVYLQALELCLSQGRQGIVLIPEISLTPQALDRFRGRFGDTVALLHSRLSGGERHDEWRRIQRGDARIVLGARSAVFAPLENIGLVIVDEEHETSYKQDGRAPRYHARHIAIKRALHNCGVAILGSATPSVESFFLAREGKYGYCFLPDRVMGRKPPQIKLVDLTKKYNRITGSLFSTYLIKRIRATLEKKEQIIIFLNRRGFSNYLCCEECGYILKCPRCDISLRLHRDPAPTLKCHYCFLEAAPPTTCPNCKGFSIGSKGGGTQKIEEELRKLFPGARILRIDGDTVSKKGACDNFYDTFSQGDADILLGTQIIAKGLDFPGVTLVGVVLADVALSLPDFRAAERTFQLVMQVAGRTARGDSPGEVVIQTYNPEHPGIACVTRGEQRSFYTWEIENRRELQYPPFCHLSKALFTGPSKEKVEMCAIEFKNLIVEGGILPEEILGPAACPVTYIHDIYRYHILIKCSKVAESTEILKKARAALSKEAVNIVIDVDSQSFL